MNFREQELSSWLAPGTVFDSLAVAYHTRRPFHLEENRKSARLPIKTM